MSALGLQSMNPLALKANDTLNPNNGRSLPLSLIILESSRLCTPYQENVTKHSKSITKFSEFACLQNHC